MTAAQRVAQFCEFLSPVMSVNNKVTSGKQEGAAGLKFAIHDFPFFASDLFDKETCLVEVFNLKAAIQYSRKNHESAIEALSDMPPRREQELDPVTLHNQVQR